MHNICASTGSACNSDSLDPSHVLLSIGVPEEKMCIRDRANSLEFTFGGGEANVAVSLANYGLDAAFVTKLPAHAIGQAAINSLRRYGVDTSMIVRGGDRVGIYYNEKGASQRGSVCIYDRANSAIQLAQPADFNWDKIFEGVDWFHFTGITPALGANVVEICLEAVSYTHLQTER